MGFFDFEGIATPKGRKQARSIMDYGGIAGTGTKYANRIPVHSAPAAPISALPTPEQPVQPIAAPIAAPVAEQPLPVVDPAAIKARDINDTGAAMAQAAKGITDTANSTPVVAAPPATPAVAAITDISTASAMNNASLNKAQDMTDQRNEQNKTLRATAISDLNNAKIALNAGAYIPNEYDRAVHTTTYDTRDSRGNITRVASPTNSNSAATVAYKNDQRKALEQQVAMAEKTLGLEQGDVNSQRNVEANRVNLQGSLVNSGVNAQRNADQNVQEAERNRIQGIHVLNQGQLMKAQGNLINEQAKNVPDKNSIAEEARKARVDATIAKGMSDFREKNPTATEQDVINHGIGMKGTLEGNQVIPGIAAVPEVTRFFGKNTPAKPATQARIVAKPTLDEFLARAKAAPQNKGVSDADLKAHYQTTYGS